MFKKSIIVFFLFAGILFISGCGGENIHFSGESENWEGSYSAMIDGSTEDGEFIFNHKQADEDMVIEDLTVTIDDGSTVRNQSEHIGSTIKLSQGCSGCAVTQIDEPIDVMIEWGEEAESFLLHPE